MKAAIQALGYDKETLEVEIIQMVQLYQNGEKMKMSKRTGKAVTLREHGRSRRGRNALLLRNA